VQVDVLRIAMSGEITTCENCGLGEAELAREFHKILIDVLEASHEEHIVVAREKPLRISEPIPVRTSDVLDGRHGGVGGIVGIERLAELARRREVSNIFTP
jgi:hypothetical protein